MKIRTGWIPRGAMGSLACLLAMHLPAAAQSGGGVDTSSVFTLLGENSSISTAKLTDRYYTNGLGLAYLSGEDQFPSLDSVSKPLWGDGAPRLALSLTQQIYTPADTINYVPPKGDRPYAGVLLANAAVVQDGANTRSSFGLNLGLVGPAALGQSLQNGWHAVIGQRAANGWGTQLANEPVFALDTARVYRFKLGTLGGLETDTLPALGATVGTLRVAAEAGLTLRIGQGLENDYGVPRVRALSGGEGFHGGDSMGWYLFAALHGQAVAHDITLDGNTFQRSRSVALTPVVGDADAGLAIVTNSMRVTYTQVMQTQEFQHQKGGPHQFGALSISLRF
jgi:lipid A 3-O-deacylase